MNYKPVIGLEVHVELKTKSKMFCGCSADYFGKEPNTHTCPVCLGLPGALPVPNKTAIEWCIKIGLAINCDIQEFSKFDRKNYFYPDLPKGYQISQYDQPFALSGIVHLPGVQKEIKIRRVHMEEDTGKLIHHVDSTLIDFNRSGVPLVEIVTEPDFESAEEVVEYLKKLQQIVRYLEVSNADMEKGDMRLEPNISLRTLDRNELPKYKVEVKNINSFRFVEKAIEYELKRQRGILEKGGTPIQETRGWDEKKGITITQRSKEEAHDYRYFSEPDIPPLRFAQNQILNIKNQIGELPDQKQKRFVDNYQLSYYNSELLTREKELADYFEQAVKDGSIHLVTPKQIANTIINKKINIQKILPAQLIQTIITSTQTVQIDQEELDKAVKKVLEENPKAVEEYKKGKTTVIMFLIGQVMKKIQKKVDTNIVRKHLEKMLQ